MTDRIVIDCERHFDHGRRKYVAKPCGLTGAGIRIDQTEPEIENSLAFMGEISLSTFVMILDRYRWKCDELEALREDRGG